MAIYVPDPKKETLYSLSKTSYYLYKRHKNSRDNSKIAIYLSKFMQNNNNNKKKLVV